MNPFTQMAESFSRIAAAMYPYTCVVRETRTTKGSSGGNIVSTPDRFPKDIPCYFRPASGRELQVASQPLSGSVYRFQFPSSLAGERIDIDGTCQIVVEEETLMRIFNVQWTAHTESRITVLASLEE